MRRRTRSGLQVLVVCCVSVGSWGCGARSGLEVAERSRPDASEDAGGDTATRFIDVSAGMRHSCAVTDVGTVYCWGWNRHGQLGLGTAEAEPYPPTMVPGVVDAVGISANAVTCITHRSGAISCWGDERGTSVSTEESVEFSNPEPMFAITDAIQVSVGSGHVCYVGSSRDVHCWGSNRRGELGRGTIDDERLEPAPVQGLRDPLDFVAVQVTAGASHTCARSEDGRIACWGDNLSGQLGVAGNESLPTAQLVSAAAPSVDVVASSGCSCSASAEGTQCWGRSFEGGLGHGEVFELREPTHVPGVGASRAASTDCSSSCAVLTDGSVWCWGNASFGRLGTSLDVAESPPVLHPDVTGAVKVSAGQEHSCALLTTGEITCWGRGQFAQLGDGRREHDGMTTTLRAWEL